MVLFLGAATNPTAETELQGRSVTLYDADDLSRCLTDFAGLPSEKSGSKWDTSVFGQPAVAR